MSLPSGGDASAAAATLIFEYGIVLVPPSFSTPPLVLALMVTDPALLTSTAVTEPAARSPPLPAQSDAVEQPRPNRFAGGANVMKSLVALSANSVPVPTCRYRIFGIVIWKSRLAVAVWAPAFVLKFDSA